MEEITKHKSISQSTLNKILEVLTATLWRSRRRRHKGGAVEVERDSAVLLMDYG